MESTRPNNTASSTASLDNHDFCISTAEALERDKEQMLKRIKQLGQTQQQLRAENQQLLSEQRQLKQQLSDAQASQSQDQRLKDMQKFIQEAHNTVSGWQQTLWDYQDASTNTAMASFLPDSAAARDLWTDQDGELEFLDNPNLPGSQEILSQFGAS